MDILPRPTGITVVSYAKERGEKSKVVDAFVQAHDRLVEAMQKYRD